MSKDVIIQEGGRGKTITADKLRTAVVGGGDCLWVPEDEVQLGEKVIDENGTYLATDDGFYGYSQVTVRGVGQAVGKDDAGNDAMAYVDPDTGQIMIDELPSELRIITPPSHGTYMDGEIISLNGMALKAYLQDGTEWGVVPVQEVLPDPMYAHFDPTHPTHTGTYDGKDYYGNSDSYVKIESITSGSFEAYEAVLGTVTGRLYCFGTAYGADSGGRGGFLCSDMPFRYRYTDQRHEWGEYSAAQKQMNERTFYLAGRNAYQSSFQPDVNAPLNDIGEAQQGENTVAYALLFGDAQESGNQTITVKWPRPGDGMELTATFTVMVAPPYDEGTDTGTGG